MVIIKIPVTLAILLSPLADEHQLIALIGLFTASAETANIPWFHARPVKRVTAGEIEAGRRLIDEGEPQQEYHDEVDSGEANSDVEVVNANTNGKRPRIEPSGLLNTGDGWRAE
jgi:hypothetical protein